MRCRMYGKRQDQQKGERHKPGIRQMRTPNVHDHPLFALGRAPVRWLRDRSPDLRPNARSVPSHRKAAVAFSRPQQSLTVAGQRRICTALPIHPVSKIQRLRAVVIRENSLQSRLREKLNPHRLSQRSRLDRVQALGRSPDLRIIELSSLPRMLPSGMPCSGSPRSQWRGPCRIFTGFPRIPSGMVILQVDVSRQELSMASGVLDIAFSERARCDRLRWRRSDSRSFA